MEFEIRDEKKNLKLESSSFSLHLLVILSGGLVIAVHINDTVCISMFWQQCPGHTDHPAWLSGDWVLRYTHCETHVYILRPQDVCRFTPLINPPGPGVWV